MRVMAGQMLYRLADLSTVWVEAEVYETDLPMVRTGMVVYLHEALDRRLAAGGTLTAADVLQATIDGSVLRLRPKLMTVSVVMASLVPILWSTGVGADVMKPIAAPIIGGMITSTIHVLINIPIIFYMLKVRGLRQISAATA